MFQKKSYFFLKDTGCVPFTFVSGPAALLMASKVFGIAVVFSRLSARLFADIEFPTLFVLYRGCD